jgi:hypothetical protein
VSGARRAAGAAVEPGAATIREPLRGDRADALDALAATLMAEAGQGRLSDLEALAALAERRAALAYDGSLPERWRYVADIVSVVTEVDLSRFPPRRRRRFAIFGERGFRAEYRSLDRHSRNQVRHLAGYLPVGFLAPVVVGSALSFAAEAAAAVARRCPLDWPDVRLGRRGVELGAAIRSGALPLAHVGRWLRSVVGEPAAVDRRAPDDRRPTPGMVDSAQPSDQPSGDSLE